MCGWRHDFHLHPELGFKEHRTAENVADLLEEFGIQIHRGIGGTGIVGILQSGDGKRSIGLRADMDALPITESGTCEYRSQHDGVMHACGHDVHTAVLLGAAEISWHEVTVLTALSFSFSNPMKNTGWALRP